MVLILPLISIAVWGQPSCFALTVYWGLPETARERTESATRTVPQLPCGSDRPTYAGLEEPAIVSSWSKSDLSRTWKPPACSGWEQVGFTNLVSIAGRFTHTSGVADLLRKVGAVSRLRGMPYWSTTHKQWQTLIVDAYAVKDEHSDERRSDFTPDELRQGKDLFFTEVNNLSGKVVYRLQLLAASENRLVLAVENASTIRYHFVPLFGAGELQSVYFFDRESDKVWRLYSIARSGKNANGSIVSNERSFINRAVAFYRYFAGIPATQEPPAAR